MSKGCVKHFPVRGGPVRASVTAPRGRRRRSGPSHRARCSRGRRVGLGQEHAGALHPAADRSHGRTHRASTASTSPSPTGRSSRASGDGSSRCSRTRAARSILGGPSAASVAGGAGRARRSGSGRARRSRPELLDRVGLSAALADRRPARAVGRPAAARRHRRGARAIEPALIVADEPVSALDVSVQAQILNLLAELQREPGLAILFVAHDPRRRRHIAIGSAVMYLGRIVETGRRPSCSRDPRHPYTQALLDGDPGARPGPPPAAVRAHGRDPEPHRTPVGVPVPPPMPGRHRAVQRRRPGDDGLRRRPPAPRATWPRRPAQRAGTEQGGGNVPTAQVNDIEINYRIEGDGDETIVLVNGLADDLETWGFQMRRSAGRGLPGAAVRQPRHRPDERARRPIHHAACSPTTRRGSSTSSGSPGSTCWARRWAG